LAYIGDFPREAKTFVTAII